MERNRFKIEPHHALWLVHNSNPTPLQRFAGHMDVVPVENGNY